MDLYGELVKVLEELAQINQTYLDDSSEVKTANLTRISGLAARVEALTAAFQATHRSNVSGKKTER